MMSASIRFKWCFFLCCSFLAIASSFAAFRNPRVRSCWKNQASPASSSKNAFNAQSDVTASSSSIWSEDELLEYASNQGVNITFSTLGPGYRAVARSKHNTSQILGYCEGFVRPTGNILHIDKMEIFRKMVLQAQKENPEFVKGGTLFGPGLLMGFFCLLHGRDKGCTAAEFLAIDDEEKQHRKLVRYYERSGFKIIKYVGDAFTDIPARMVWGGCGTLMRQDIDTLLREWTALLERAKNNSKPTRM